MKLIKTPKMVGLVDMRCSVCCRFGCEYHMCDRCCLYKASPSVDSLLCRCGLILTAGWCAAHTGSGKPSVTKLLLTLPYQQQAQYQLTDKYIQQISPNYLKTPPTGLSTFYCFQQDLRMVINIYMLFNWISWWFV